MQELSEIQIRIECLKQASEHARLNISTMAYRQQNNLSNNGFITTESVIQNAEKIYQFIKQSNK